MALIHRHHPVHERTAHPPQHERKPPTDDITQQYMAASCLAGLGDISMIGTGIGLVPGFPADPVAAERGASADQEGPGQLQADVDTT